MIVDDLKASILNFAISGNFVKNSNNNVSTELQTLYKMKERQILNKEVLISAKIFPVKEVPFQVPSNWEWVRLGNISKVVSKGTTPQGGKNAYKESGIKFLRAENVKNYKIDETNIQYISEEVHQNFLKRSILEDKDLLICIAGTLGRCGIVSEENLPLNTNQAVSFVRMIDTNLINVKYIAYAISSPIIQNILIEQKKITAIPNLTLEIIANCLIPLPPLEEQNRIVDKLEQLFSKLDEVKPIENELLALKIKFPIEMKKSIIQSAVSGQLTTQNSNESVNLIIEKIENKINKKVRKVSNYPFEIPKNWLWIKFGDLVNFEIGKTPPRADSSFWNGEFNWVSISDMVEGGSINKTKETVSFKANNELFKGKISKIGTLLMSFKLTVGRCSILDIDAFHNEGIISIYPNYDSAILKGYLFKILPFIVKFGDTKGAIKGNTLNSKSLDELMIPLPPIEEQQRIVDKLEQLLTLCEDIDTLINK